MEASKNIKDVRIDKINPLLSSLKENVIPNDCIQSNPKKWTWDSYGLTLSKNTSISIAYTKWKPKTPFANLRIEISLLVKSGEIINNDAINGIKINIGIEISVSINIANPRYYIRIA